MTEQAGEAFDYPDPPAPPPPPRPITNADLLVATTRIVGSMLIGEHMAARLINQSGRVRVEQDLATLFLSVHSAIERATVSQPAAPSAAHP